MSNWYLYQHIRLDKQEPFYIGIGQTKEYKRAYSKRSRSQYWKNIISKTDYIVEILLEGLTKEEASKKERELISLIGRADLGKGTLVNLTDGGDGTLNIIRTLETIEKQRQSLKGFKHSLESIEKIREASRNISQTTRDKMSESRKGKKRNLSPEAIERMRQGAINSHKRHNKIIEKAAPSYIGQTY